jgi:hypothetical protein
MPGRDKLGALPLNGPAPESITSLASTFPTPTNALAVAALDAVPQWATATEAIAAGIPEPLANSFLPPHGVMPWMRLVAFGYDSGDIKAPEDTAWWAAPYALDLYSALGTWVDALAGSGHTSFAWDQQTADGDSGSIAQSLTVSATELEDVVEQEACPKFIMPKKRGQMPIPNPKCWTGLKEGLRDIAEKLHGGKKSNAPSMLLWLAFGYLVLKGKL